MQAIQTKLTEQPQSIKLKPVIALTSPIRQPAVVIPAKQVGRLELIITSQAANGNSAVPMFADY